MLTLTQPLIHLDKYILGSIGKTSSCPVGYAQADKANCAVAARLAGIAAGANNQNTGWLEGGWGHVPVGCSINAAAVTGAGSWRTHWNTQSSGENSGQYRVVCAHTGRNKWLCLSVVIVAHLFIVLVPYPDV